MAFFGGKLNNFVKPPLILRLCSIVMLVFVAAFCVLFILFGRTHYLATDNGFDITMGQADLAAYDFLRSPPVSLNGEWEFYPGLYLTPATFLEIDEKALETTELPYYELQKLLPNNTFRLFVKVDPSSQNMAIYLPFNDEQLNIYFNGALVSATERGWLRNFIYARYLVNVNVNPALEYQEIIISSHSNSGGMLFYRNPVLFGDRAKIADHAIWSWSNVFFSLGFLIAIFVNGLIFMTIRPAYKKITYLTLFDSLLMMRIIFGTNAVYLAFQSATEITLDTSFLAGAQLFFLLLAGVMGCLLVYHTFCPQGLSSALRALNFAPVAVYAALAMLLPLNVQNYGSFDKYWVYAVFFLSLAITMYHIVIALKNRFSLYFLLQAVKTLYFCGIFYFDIYAFQGKHVDFFVLEYLYIGFFLLHLIVRLIDNNNSYRSVETFNGNLERLVQQRTEELTLANQKLSELSIKDSLTQIYNRMHTERLLEIKIEEAQERRHPLYLCIADLDYFKSINDRFGHAAGDDELRSFVKTVSELLPENSAFGRIGGEEFVIIAWDLPSESMELLLENIRSQLELNIYSGAVRTTASFGLTRYEPGMDVKQLLKKADTCLYQAKALGRNRVVSNLSGYEPELRRRAGDRAVV